MTVIAVRETPVERGVAFRRGRVVNGVQLVARRSPGTDRGQAASVWLVAGVKWKCLTSFWSRASVSSRLRLKKLISRFSRSPQHSMFLL